MHIYDQAIEILYKEYRWQESIRAPKETLDALQKKIHALYMENPNRRGLPHSIRKLAENPGYISVRDMEPKRDPGWESFKEQMGIGNPPDSIDDMGDIMEEIL